MLTPFVILACAVVAALVGWQLGGPEGAGVFAGYLAGGGAAALGAARQQHLARYRPREVMRGTVEGLLLKLGFVLGGVLVFRFLEPAAARVDWRYFLVAFALTALVVATVATLRISRELGGAHGGGAHGGGARGEGPPRRGDELREEMTAL